MLSLGVTLQNKGLYDMDSVEVTMDITDGGAYSYQDSTIISIASWETLLVTFDWDIPAEEGAAYHVAFSLSPDDEDSNNYYSLDLDAHYHALDITTPKNYDAIEPGDVLWYRLEVTDQGTFGTDDITFESDLPGGWDWWVQKEGGNISHVVVEGSVQLELFVKPDTSVLGEYPFEFSAVSENGVTRATQDLTGHIVLADLVPVGVKLLRADGKEKKLVAGDNTTMVLEVQNVGSQDTGVYDVSLDDDGSSLGEEVGPEVTGDGRVNITFVHQFTEGSHNLTFVVDVEDAVKEYDEANNIFIIQIQVWPGTASTPFEFMVKVQDRFGENVTGAHVTAKSGGSLLESITDDSGNRNLTLMAPYREGSVYLVEAFSGDLYASATILVYSEDIFVEITLIVGRYSIVLTCDERDRSIMPNGDQSFFFNITNTGDFNDSYLLSLTGLPLDWTATFSGDGITDELLYLEKDGPTQFVLNLTAWRYAPAHERYEIVLTASSQTSPYTVEDIILRVTVLLVDNITLYTEDPDEHGLPGDPITHRVFVNNSGNSVRTINLIVTGDTDYSSLNKEKFTLAPGDTEDVLFIIQLPNLRTGTVLYHELYGIISGVGITPSHYFTTLIDRTATNIFEAEVQEDELIVTNTGNHMEHVTVTVQTALADIVLLPDAFDIDMEKSVSIGMELHMTDMSIPYGSLIPVFVSIYNGERYFINETRYVAVPAVKNLSLSVENTTLKVIPGSTAEFSILVVNTGNVQERIFFGGTNSGPEPIILPSPIILQRNKEEYVKLLVQLPSDASGKRWINITGRAGDTEVPLGLLIDLSVDRDIVLDEIAVRTNDQGTRFTINLFNNGEAEERLHIETSCGELDLVLTEVKADEYVQFHVLVHHGQYCSEFIHVNATSPLGKGISTSIDLIPPPFIEIQILGTLPAGTIEPLIFRATGDYSSYSWEIDSRIRLGKEIYYNFTTPGSYPISLTVKDTRDIYSVFTTEVIVENQPPFIVMETHLYGDAGENIAFDATGSWDPDGSITNFNWAILGQTHVGPEVFHAFDSEGMYNVTLTVTDDGGGINSTTVQVTIRESPGKLREEKEELNMTIIVLSLLILMGIIGGLLYFFKQLDFEKDSLLDKFGELESGSVLGETGGAVEAAVVSVVDVGTRSCPKCGHSVLGNFNFCNKCGTTMKSGRGMEHVPEKVIFCIECGAKVPDKFRFCNKCGAPLDHEEVGS